MGQMRRISCTITAAHMNTAPVTKLMAPISPRTVQELRPTIQNTAPITVRNEGMIVYIFRSIVIAGCE